MRIYLGPYPDANQEREEEIEIHHYDHWNLSNDLAVVLIPLLSNFKENTSGFPGDLPNMEVWHEYLDAMNSAFQIIVTNNDFERTKQQERIVQDGLTLFARYFEHLWD